MSQAPVPDIRVPTCRLYVDESGDHRYDNLEQIPYRYLTLLGCVFERTTDYKFLSDKMTEIKKKYWPQSDPDKPVILHREDIVYKKGYFHILQDEKIKNAFDTDILDLISRANYTVINVTLDKGSHFEKYKYPDHPYKYCMETMMERYTQWLKSKKTDGDIMAESRGKEDLHLKQVYRQTWLDGTRWVLAKDFQEFLTSREIKIKPKTINIAGLQLADLLAYPLKEKILFEKGIRKDNFRGKHNEVIYKAVMGKIRKKWNGNIAGYGEIFIS